MNDGLPERRTDPDVLADIRTRLALIESDLQRGSKTMAWLRGIAVVVVLQVGAFIYGYAQLQIRVDSINLEEFETALITLEKNMTTAMTVLGDHGTEFADVREEQARIRGQLDQFHSFLENVRQKADSQTRDRFYKDDGDRLEARIKRLEDKLLN